jgi:hypothetical protein
MYFLAAFIMFVLFSSAIFLDHAIARRVDISQHIIISTDNIAYTLESEYAGGFSVEISGWIVNLGEDIIAANSSVILHDLDRNAYYKIKTQTIPRPDVTMYINDGHDYDLSGFSAKGLIPFLRRNTHYRVFILLMNNGDTFLFPLDEYIIT